MGAGLKDNAQAVREPERIAILQGLRAYAALAVLLFHAGHAAAKHAGENPLLAVTFLGQAGVDLFFVLSGFVILHSVVAAGKTPGSYAYARIKRIFVPYWPIGIAFACYTYGFTHAEAATPSAYLASLTLMPIGRPALNVAWTLQHEVVFYSLVGAMLFTGWWRRGFALWGASIALCWLLGIAAPKGLQPIDLEFLMGAAAWAVWNRGNSLWLLRFSIALSAGGLCLALVSWTSGSLSEIGRIAVAAQFAAALPWLIRAEQAGLVHTPKPVLFLGDASYSIYLTHVVGILLLAPLMQGLGPMAALVSATIAGLAAGIAYYLLIERPLMRALPRASFS